MQTGIPCALMRGGTSRGLYFLADDLPNDVDSMKSVLRAAMGSPDVRQIDGVGGAHPLTSKVAIVSRSMQPDADVDYHFWQVAPDTGEVSDSQNCGNILAGVGPFAIERGLVEAGDEYTDVRIRMVNTDSYCVARVLTPGGQVEYEGDARIDGVPGTHAPITLEFLDVAGSSCGALLPTGNARDEVLGAHVTCIDNGMPVVLIDARELGKTGTESPQELESDTALKARIEEIRLAVGPLMNLGDVADKTVPKMTLLSPPVAGGDLCTRSFIPHRVHDAIGVLGAVSVATGLAIRDSVAQTVTAKTLDPGDHEVEVEHPTGAFTVALTLEQREGKLAVTRSALLRTARLLMDGQVFVPSDLLNQ